MKAVPEVLLMYVVTAVVGVVSGVLITLGTELAKAHYLRPKLVIVKDSPENGSTWSIHTAVVRNTGKTVARNCVGWITPKLRLGGCLLPSQFVGARPVPRHRQ